MFWEYCEKHILGYYSCTTLEVVFTAAVGYALFRMLTLGLRTVREMDRHRKDSRYPVIQKHPVEQAAYDQNGIKIDKGFSELKMVIKSMRRKIMAVDQKVNILFYGYVSCGKSSLINTFFDAMRDSNYTSHEWGISQQVAKVGHHNADCTQFHKRYNLTDNIQLWDVWGHREPLDRVITAFIDGIARPDEEGMIESIPRVELRNERAMGAVHIDDKAHFIIFVFSAESSPVPKTYWKLYKDLQEVLNRRGDEIHHCLALTKLDVLDPNLEREPHTAKDSMLVREFVDELVEDGGVAPQDIYPIINRHNFKYQNSIATLDFWALELLRTAVEGALQYRERMEERQYSYGGYSQDGAAYVDRNNDYYRSDRDYYSDKRSTGGGIFS